MIGQSHVMIALVVGILVVDVSSSKSEMPCSKIGHSDEAFSGDISGDFSVSQVDVIRAEFMKQVLLTFRTGDRGRLSRFLSTFRPLDRC